MSNPEQPVVSGKVILWDAQEGQFGLGDRIRGIASGMALVEKLNAALLVRWARNEHSGERLEELLDIEGVFGFSDSDEIPPNLDICRRLDCDLSIMPHDFYPYLREIQLADLFNGYEDFFESWVLCLKRIAPVPETAAKIDAFADEYFTPDTVGIHLRRTDVLFDDLKPIGHDNISSHDLAVLSEVYAINAQNPGTRFFLATDSGSYFQAWIHMLKQAGIEIFGYEKEWKQEFRQTRSEDALIDLFLLCRCSRVVASLPSSFLLIVKAVTGVQPNIVKID
jgi:hypothetical protein